MPDVMLVRDRTALPASYAAEWEAVLLRTDQSTGWRTFLPQGTWYTLPMPFTFADVVGRGHDGAWMAGSIAEVEWVDTALVARGWYADTNKGWRALGYALRKEITGLSVDLGEDAEVIEDENGDLTFIKWTITGVTGTPHPALPSAGVLRIAIPSTATIPPDVLPFAETVGVPFTVAGAADRAAGGLVNRLTGEAGLVAGGVAFSDPVWQAFEERLYAHLDAGGAYDRASLRSVFGPSAPVQLDVSVKAFANPGHNGPTPPTLDKDGRFHGHLALWNVCHNGFGVAIGQGTECVLAPRSRSGYAYFNTAPVVLTGGATVKVGRLTVGTGHAPVHFAVDRAVAHYDNTGTVAAFVRMGEDEHGIWFSGVLSPFATAEQHFAAITSQFSGHWCSIRGDLELCAGLGVNMPGFPIPVAPAYALTASGAPMSLIAASPFTQESPMADVCKCGHNYAAAKAGGTETADEAIDESPALVASVSADLIALPLADGKVAVYRDNERGAVEIRTTDELLEDTLTTLGLTADGFGALSIAPNLPPRGARRSTLRRFAVEVAPGDPAEIAQGSVEYLACVWVDLCQYEITGALTLHVSGGQFIETDTMIEATTPAELLDAVSQGLGITLTDKMEGGGGVMAGLGFATRQAERRTQERLFSALAAQAGGIPTLQEIETARWNELSAQLDA